MKINRLELVGKRGVGGGDRVLSGGNAFIVIFIRETRKFLSCRFPGSALLSW